MAKERLMKVKESTKTAEIVADTAAAAKDPMDRLAVLEHELAEANAQRATMGAAIAERDAQLTALQSTVEVFKQASADRRSAEVAAYTADLQTKATALQSPIPADDMEKIAELFGAGRDDTARVLGDAFLSRAEARASTGGAPAAATPLGSSAGRTEVDRQEMMASMYRATGGVATVTDGKFAATPRTLKNL
jgi:Mg-chelatase subunit ChlI